MFGTRKTKKKIVVIGGGTGTHTVITGLKRYVRKIELTAVVAMTDSGGSTGRLRDEFGYLPVGDVRMALVALAKEDGEYGDLLRKLFLHRFNTSGNVSGHNFGNLFLVALTDILGSEGKAIEAASRVLRVCGTVVPVTNEKSHLVATYDDGRVVTGEHEIDEPPTEYRTSRITHLAISPPAKINPDADEAIRSADALVIGPGDLYTSLLANCVVEGVPQALKESKGKIIYVSNLMTKLGQTTGMSVKDHVCEIDRYIGRTPDIVLCHEGDLRADLLERYEMEDEFPVKPNTEGLSSMIVSKDLVATEEVVTASGDVLKRSLIRHDPIKLAGAIMDQL